MEKNFDIQLTPHARAKLETKTAWYESSGVFELSLQRNM
jgi:hypothetical protein